MANNMNVANVIRAPMDYYMIGKAAKVSPDTAFQMLKNFESIASNTAEEPAFGCNVSVSTVHRFYKALGFSTYSEFKIKFADSVERYPFDQELYNTRDVIKGESIYSTIIKEAKASLESIEKAVPEANIERFAEVLHGADTVYIHDPVYRPEYSFIGEPLVLTGKSVVFSNVPEDWRSDIRAMNSSSVLLAACSGRQRWLALNRELAEVKKTGAKICAIAYTDIPEPALCDGLIKIEPTFNSTQATLQGILLIILAAAYRKKYLPDG